MYVMREGGVSSFSDSGPGFATMCNIFMEQPLEWNWFDENCRNIGWMFMLLVRGTTKFNETNQYGAVLVRNPHRPLIINRSWTIIGTENAVESMKRHLRYDNFAEPRSPY